MPSNRSYKSKNAVWNTYFSPDEYIGVCKICNENIISKKKFYNKCVLNRKYRTVENIMPACRSCSRLRLYI